MKRVRVTITLIVVILMVCGAGFYINLKIYDFLTPAVKWVKASVVPRIVEAVSEKPVVAQAGAAEPSGEKDAAVESSDEKVGETESAEPVKAEEEAKPVGGDETAAKISDAKPAEANKPSEPNEPSRGERDRGGDRRRGDRADQAKDEPQGDPNNPMEALNLKDFEMKDIVAKLSAWTGKVIIASDEAMQQKITIYSSKKLPRKEAISIIYAALRAKGFVAEETSDNMIMLKPIKDAKLGSVPAIPATTPLASIENKNQVVQYTFGMKSYSVSKMSDILRPLAGDYGYISANEDLRTILVIDTVENLMRFEKIIAQFDIPGTEKTVEEVFEIKYGDPAEIVQMLKMLLSGEAPSRSQRGGRSGDSNDRSKSDKRSKREGGSEASKAGGVTAVTVSSERPPIVLIPEPNRKWIIARASPEDIESIRQWIAKLDRAETMSSEYETIALRFANAREVADRLNEVLQKMGGGITPSVFIQPLEQAGQIVVYGREDIRKVVKDIVEEIDVPSGMETRVFPLEHADPEQVKISIEALYETQSGYSSSYRNRSYSSRVVEPKDTVKVIADTMMQQVTVIASPENMVKIAEQIAKWDIPLDVEKVRPKILELKNSDPIRMAALLSKLFSEAEQSGRTSFFDYYFGGSQQGSKKKIVGALYGQLTFEPVPDTRKIIVISKIPQAYKVVEDLINELDSRETADVPNILTLKYADAEELSDQLNAILNPPGTTAKIWRSTRGLSEILTDSTGQTQTQTGQTNAASREEIVPWWSSGGQQQGAALEMPISNIIGRIRFVPVQRSKAIMVLSPPEYMDEIRKMVEALDQPGKQVVVKAIIVEVNHSAMTSLGVKLASDPSAFGFLSEGALTMLSQFAYQENRAGFNSGVPGAANVQGASTNFNLNVLVDLLIKNANGRILNQPTLWTKDNEEASFFRGQEVAFVEGDSVSPQGGSSSTFRRDDVGLMLRVRPNITPENNVDMIIQLEVTQLEQETVNTQPVTSKLNMTTNLIGGDGETKMLAGILLKSESDIQQKVPLLGDAPLVGGLFRHKSTLDTNKELLVFLTPYVIDTVMKDKTEEELKKAEMKLKKMLEDLNASVP